MDMTVALRGNLKTPQPLVLMVFCCCSFFVCRVSLVVLTDRCYDDDDDGGGGDHRSCLGMHLFGGKFCQKADGSLCTCKDLADSSVDCQCDRKHFNSFLWATVTVFQVCANDYLYPSLLLLPFTDMYTR